MSHFTTTTPTMCAFLLFTHCTFHSHPHHHKWCSYDSLSNGVLSHSTNAMCHPPLSPTQPHPHPCLPTQQTHTIWKVSPQQIPNTHTAMVKAIQQMHVSKDKAEVHSVLGCGWIAWRLHERQWGIDTVHQMTC